jgi:DNA-directed RNA polymerase subunit RPC12/RpoP
MVLVEYRCRACGRVLFEAEDGIRTRIIIRCKKCGDWNTIQPR